MGKKVNCSDEQLNVIKTLFNEGNGSRTIAKMLGLTRSIIKRVFNDLGLDGSNRGTPKRPFTGLEKVCKRCGILKNINEFNLINAGNNRLVYRYCIGCEKDFIKENNARYKKNKIKNDAKFLLNKNIADMINLSIKNYKNNEIEEVLPYSLEELRKHLESLFEPWMNWDNYGIYNKQSWDDDNSNTWKWNIDHIIPKSKFNFSSINDQSFIDCWSLSNLRPLNAKQNLLDGVKRIRH